MPPEPLPWDRRELIFREKKHDRGPPYGDALGSNGNSSTFRWRESYHNPRDFPGHSVRRSQSGYGRHHGIGNGYQDISGEDPCSRSEDGEFRGYQAGRYGNGVCRNNNRESGGFFRRSSDSGDISRQNPEYVASQSSAVDSSSHPSPRILLNDDKQDASRDDVEHDLKTSQRQDRDLGHTLGSLSWKPLKWNRSGSFSSSSKIQKTESEEKKLEVVSPTGKETSVESPVSSPLSPDEGFSRRKQRLGWGQGLAKYERSKTEVSEDLCPRHPSQSDDASLGIAIPAGSTSPPTPASVTCSSSHGGDDKVFSEVTTNGAATSRSLGDDIRQFLDELSISHEYLDLNSPISLTSKIRCLSEIDDGSRGDSSSIAKLLFVKDIVLRQLEKTESDIDSFECELKKLNGDKQSTSKMDDLDSKKNDGPEDRSLFVDEQTDTTSPKLPISESSQLQGDNVPDVSSPSTAECYQESLPLEDGGGGDSSLADFEEEFESLASSIIDSNQEIAKRASLDLDSRASGYSPALQTSESSDNFSDQEKEVLMKKMIGVRKCNSKFKEQVLSLKYRAILRMWKEDMQIHQIRKQRSRSCKKMEPSRSSNHNGQKTRSHVRIRLPLHGSSSSDPTPEAVEFAGRLLSDSHPRIFRNVLKMPALILDEKEKACSRFLTKNGLVEDPISLEKERPLTNSWSPEERSLFIEMLGLYRKDFSKISSFLDHKTTADCIEFYYKNHKSEDFAKAKKKSQDAPAGNFLGAASSSSSKWKRQVVPRQPYPSSSKVSSEAEQETCAADVLVGIMAVTERRLSSSTAGGGSEDLWSEDGGEDMCSGDWTDEEKSAFISALSSHGRDFAFISRCVGSRSVEQCKIFFSKARKSLALDEILGRASGIDDVDSATCAKPEEDPVEPDPCSLPKRSRSSVEDGLSDEGEVKRRKTSPPSDWPEQSVKLFGKILNQPPSSPEKSTSNFLGLPSCGFTAGVDGSSAMLLGGNGCSNGGEPVAAIKLHYVARAGVLSREEESWRADVGR